MSKNLEICLQYRTFWCRKTSLVNALLEQDSQIRVSISHTTREKRDGEIDGQDYFFVDSLEFKSMCESDYFLESATVLVTIMEPQSLGFLNNLKTAWM